MGIRDEIRADRAAKREQDRADKAQQAEQRRADAAAQREQDRADRQHRQQLKAQRAAARRERRAAALRWVSAHPIELLMSVIVIVPALLAWTAMARYGQHIYGPVGWLLPLFTEGAMWAFAFAAHTARRGGQPTSWLLTGVWIFAGAAAALNLLHGLAVDGWLTAAVMATVSVGGVVAHQIITAAPMRTRRSRAERAAARTQRQARRRTVRMERAALHQAVGQLADDGTVTLLHRPGTVTLTRTWTGRRHLARTSLPGHGDDGPHHAPAPTGGVAEEIEQWLRESPSPESLTDPTGTAGDPPGDLHRDRADTPSPDTGVDEITDPPRRSLTELREQLRQAVQTGTVDPSSAESIRKTLRIGRDRAKQLRDEWTDTDGPAGVTAA
ncbi:DUF2637 domain-containing protein [Actinopolyspora mortivallis]|uniref:DUF2637 domain-containing protein n=1 Tax=Actinopolyspora mortivallis TaxID=33906 RepID=A0A2T0GSR3_ACTMO|nr:DUF2637 domain-containing protein [Actinopolyspora mortivallis]PRW62131.1 hypothetical protein CEP50_17220 [Actinopolyspora mortivallis]